MSRKPEIGNVVLYPDRPLRKEEKNGYVLKFYCPIQRRRIRKNCGTRDRRKASGILRECRARLINGDYVKSGGAITEQDQLRFSPTEQGRVAVAGDEITWDAASEAFRHHKEIRLRPKSVKDYKSRLEKAGQLLQNGLAPRGPLLIKDALRLDSLEMLQDQLLTGEQSRLKQRSPHTVNSVVRAVMTFARYCHRHGWITDLPPIRTVPYDEAMKGRPITGEEFDRMLAATTRVVGEGSAAAWRFALELLWESGFRVGDLMDFSWDDPRHIHIVWPISPNGHPTIVIPSTQKNGKCDEIPMLPALQKLLERTPAGDRHGWVIDPPAVEFEMKCERPWFMPNRDDLIDVSKVYGNSAIGRACGVSETTVRKWLNRLGISGGHKTNTRTDLPISLVEELRNRPVAKTRHTCHLKGRMSVERVSRIICEIGRKAGVIVRKEDAATGQETKYASAHDLRRSCAERLINAGVSAETLKVIFRHRDFATTEKFYGARRKAQSAGDELRRVLVQECKKPELVGGLMGGLEGELSLNPVELKKLKALLGAI